MGLLKVEKGRDRRYQQEKRDKDFDYLIICLSQFKAFYDDMRQKLPTKETSFDNQKERWLAYYIVEMLYPVVRKIFEKQASKKFVILEALELFCKESSFKQTVFDNIVVIVNREYPLLFPTKIDYENYKKKRILR